MDLTKKIYVDYANMEVTANLLVDEPTILIISEGKVQCIAMHDHGQFIAKSHEGRITAWENTEKGKM